MGGIREGSLSTLDDALQKYLRSRGLVRAGRESMVALVWPEVVGEWYAQHTQVLRVERGIVEVRCDSAPRAQQLQLDSPAVIEALNKRLGGPVVREIRPSSGGIRRRGQGETETPDPGPPLPTRWELEAMELTDEERAWVRETVAPVEAEDLRRALESVLVKFTKLNRWKREHGWEPCVTCGALVAPGRRQCSSCNPGRVPQQGSLDVLQFPKWPDRA
jgi:predicted nucleic acid-binding Zn ribbon protein